MKTRLLTSLRWVLMLWGAISLLCVIAAIGWVFYALEWGNQPEKDKASANDVRFVLNWCKLGNHRIQKVEKSYVSARSFTGDHLDAYVIQISPVELAELTTDSDEARGRWYRGDQLPKTLEDVVSTVGWYHHEIPWFPTVDELKSVGFYVYPWSIYLSGLHPIASELIFIRPADNRIFYFSSKT